MKKTTGILIALCISLAILLILCLWLYWQQLATGISISIDTSLRPAQEDLPGYESNNPRPLATIIGNSGLRAHFVENEIIVTTEDQATIDRLSDRYNATVLAQVDPSIAGISSEAKTYLLRVEPTAVALPDLAENLNALTRRIDSNANDDLRISSEAGADLLGLAAIEARRGIHIGINFVFESDAIPYSTVEGFDPVGGYTPNAYDWNYYKRGHEPGQIHGVTAAWGLLHRTGNLSSAISIAILDGGFTPDADFRNGPAISMVPFMAPLNTPSPSIGADWHGSWVASTALAIPDNHYGTAGTAGPVGTPLYIYTIGDMFSSIPALMTARSQGAKIANMSYSTPVPFALSWSVLPFEAVTDALCDDMLCFASAGNDRTNVDRKTCAEPFDWPCWEKTWFTPCENNGVICVGGLGGTGEWHNNSNYGKKHVDIFAPHCVWVGPDRDKTITEPQLQCGTSMAAPFTAGVAALVWSAAPGYSAQQVWQTMKNTARVDHDPHLDQEIRKVDAYSAVLKAIGKWHDISFWRPLDGAVLPQGRVTDFIVDVHTISATSAPIPLLLTWESDRDGVFASEPTNVGIWDRFASAAALSAGEHSVTVRAMALMPPYYQVTRSDTIQVSVENLPPTVTIHQPMPDAEYCEGDSVYLYGIGSDPNEVLPDSAYLWQSNLDGAIEPGAQATTETLTVGRHNLTLTVADSAGLYATDSVSIRIMSSSDTDCEGNSAPLLQIIEPLAGAYHMASHADDEGLYAYVRLVAHVSDREDDPAELAVQWSSSIEGSVGRRQRHHGQIAHGSALCRAANTISATVTDSAGNRTEQSVTIFIMGPPC